MIKGKPKVILQKKKKQKVFFKEVEDTKGVIRIRSRRRVDNPMVKRKKKEKGQTTI